MIFSAIFALLFLSFTIETQATAAYNATLSNELWYYNTAAYCKPSRIQNWAVADIQEIYPSVTDIHVYFNSFADNLGFLAYNPDTNRIVLTFRGTMDLSIMNWVQDFTFLFTKYSQCSGCYVHLGFKAAYNNINPREIMNDLKALSDKYPSATIAITGHSLGGAMANLAYIDACELLGDKISLVYTYGSPRVGNKAFSRYLNGLKCGKEGRMWQKREDGSQRLVVVEVVIIEIAKKKE